MSRAVSIEVEEKGGTLQRKIELRGEKAWTTLFLRFMLDSSRSPALQRHKHIQDGMGSMRSSMIEDMLTIVSRNIYDSATQVMSTASAMIPANTFCIAINDRLTTTVLRSFNRANHILDEGLVVDNEDSYCHLVIEKSKGPLVIGDNLTHPLTREMDATKLVGGCSFMGVPIVKRKGEVYGSLCAFDHEFYAYNEKEVAFMSSLAAFFANVLELEDAANALKDAHQTIYSLAEEKSNLLAVMSHEIRTPLNGIIGMIDLLQSTEPSEEQLRYIEIAKTSGDSLLAILNDILSYAKLESEAKDLSFHSIQLEACIKQVHDLMFQNAASKGIKLHMDIDSSVPDTLFVDVTKLHQIIINLVSNAIKFTDSGSVTIMADTIMEPADSPRLLLKVRDTGSGIDSKKLDQLFQPFSQLHAPSRSEQYGGTGLGLSICKKLAEQLGGNVWLVESSESGSCFALNLPLFVSAPLE
ncbi:GAF domain-containing protein [Paenibacillus sinopodophylli]|uniref:GAF domain-containing sensor histidine kinase n=1 Tax=Paenibacillus sinopodophylli TaxID=1837342 RepID=UPI001FE42D68|nr:GAF domain-containing protein [Paenibacillus sinopodophylli]